jgi:hypothetical protein
MTKTEKTVIAVLVLVVGILLIALRATFLEMLLIVGGVCVIGLGVIDVFRGIVPPAVLKIVSGGLLILCCVFVVKAVLFIISALLITAGILLLYEKLKRRRIFCSWWLAVFDFALPALFLAIGALLLFNQGKGSDWVFIVCGVFTVLIGGVILLNEFLEN